MAPITMPGAKVAIQVCCAMDVFQTVDVLVCADTPGLSRFRLAWAVTC
jgi:hypothetical protein